MDDIERKLYHDLSLKTEIPEKCEEIIKNGLNRKKKHYSWAKIIVVSCASFMITAGVVYAGTKVIESIWKEPKKIEGYMVEETITKEEKKNLISEIEAKNKAKEILKKFDYKNEEIKMIELDKNMTNYKINWCVETNNGITLDFDANGGKSLALFNDSILEKDIEKYHTTKEEAENIARNLCKNFGYNLDDYTYVEIDTNKEKIEESYIWYVNFYKKYNELVDRYNGISIAFIPEINEIYYFIVYEENYENNPVEVAEEKAKEIALNEEKKTELGYEIKNTETELAIVSMNGEAYARTNNYKQFCEQRNIIDYPEEKYIEYRTDKHIRKAWKVTIEYKLSGKNLFKENFNNQDLGYVYYIDATTGEVIGGEDYSNPVIQ